MLVVGGNALAQNANRDQLIGETIMILDLTDKKVVKHKDAFDDPSTIEAEKCRHATEALKIEMVAGGQLQHLMREYPELKEVAIMRHFLYHNSVKINKIANSVQSMCGDPM